MSQSQGKPRVYFEEADRKKVEFYVAGIVKRELPKRVREAKRHLKNCSIDELRQTLTNAIRGNLSTGYFLYCLTGNRDHPLLWSHYSNSHAGICIHFDATSQQFGGAFPIRYQENYPTVDKPWSEEKHHTLERAKIQLLTKAGYWKYEEEFRLIHFDGYQMGFNFNKQFGQFPKGLIKGITIGAKMPDKKLKKLVKMVEDSGSDIPIDRAVLADDKFRLEFQPL